MTAMAGGSTRGRPAMPPDHDDLLQELYFAMRFVVGVEELRNRFPEEARMYCRTVRRMSGERFSDAAILGRLTTLRKGHNRPPD